MQDRFLVILESPSNLEKLKGQTECIQFEIQLTFILQNIEQVW